VFCVNQFQTRGAQTLLVLNLLCTLPWVSSTKTHAVLEEPACLVLTQTFLSRQRSNVVLYASVINVKKIQVYKGFDAERVSPSVEKKTLSMLIAGVVGLIILVCQHYAIVKNNHFKRRSNQFVTTILARSFGNTPQKCSASHFTFKILYSIVLIGMCVDCFVNWFPSS